MTSDQNILPNRSAQIVSPPKGRFVLAMSSGVNILPNTPTQITSRPRKVAFHPERMIIGDAGDWIVNDVRVDNRSQFTQGRDFPGEVFASETIHDFLKFEMVQTTAEFVMIVTYVGSNSDGAPFVSGVLGTADPSLNSDGMMNAQRQEDTRRRYAIQEICGPGGMIQEVTEVDGPRRWTNLSTPVEPVDSPLISDAARQIADRLASAALTALGFRSESATRSAPPAADRAVLPMSSIDNVLPGSGRPIAARPQNDDFQPMRILIAGDPSHWVINDVKIGSRSQFAQSGDVPGEAFATVDVDLEFDVVPRDQPLTIFATYVGPLKEGATFVCAVIGHVAADTATQYEARPGQMRNLRALDAHLSNATIRSRPSDRFASSSSSSIIRRALDRIALAGLALLGYEVVHPPMDVRRITLPMSSGSVIMQNASAQITSRPQTGAFRPERIVVGGTPSHWIISDIKIGNQSQLAQSGDIPGEMFAFDAKDNGLRFGVVQTAMDFVIIATYVGPKESGEPFVCGVFGTAAV